MKIKRIKIDRFGGLRDFSLDFSDGFNLVFGNNEDGKTTVLSFLRLMFYGNGTNKSDLSVNLRRRFTPFSGDKMAGEVEFTHEGRDYLLSKQFGKTQRSDKTVLLDCVSGTPVTVEGEIGEALFGMSCAAFERSIFISGFIPAEDGSAELSARLASLLYSGDDKESYADVKDRLAAAAGAMHTSRKKGTADRLAEKLAALETEKQKALETERRQRENLSLLEENEERLKGLCAQKATLLKLSAQSAEREKLKELRVELERRNTLRALEQENGALDAKALAAAEQRAAEHAALTAESAAKRALLTEDIARADDNISARLDEVLAELGDTNRRIDDAQQKIAEAENKKGTSSVGMIYLLPAVIFAAAAAAGAFANLIFLLLLVPAALLALTGLVLKAKSSASANRTELLLLDLKRELTAAEDDKRRLSDEHLILSERKKLAQESADKAAAERARIADDADKAAIAARTARNEALALLGYDNGDLHTLISSCRERLSRIRALREWLDSSPYRDMTDEQLREKLTAPQEYDLKTAEEYSHEIKALEAQINTAHATSARMLSENEGLLRSCRTVGVIENDIHDTRAALAEQEAHFEALGLAAKFLDEAYDEMRRNFAPELNRVTSELLSSLTGGRHDRTAVSNDLALTVSEEGAVPFSADYLSAGSLDQAELCLRLAIAKLTGGGRFLPLLLDDVLMQYDDERARLATRFLADYAKNNQVLLFTCHGSFRDMAEKENANIVNMR